MGKRARLLEEAGVEQRRRSCKSRGKKQKAEAATRESALLSFCFTGTLSTPTNVIAWLKHLAMMELSCGNLRHNARDVSK